MLLGITGFAIVVLMVVLLLKGKAMPIAVFTVLPIAGAFINSFSLEEIIGFVKTGVGTVWPMAALFVFVVTYFGIMSDVGMFDKLVEKLVKVADGRVTGLLLVVSIVAMLGHLDGNSPTTYLITIPALLPLCKKLNIRTTSVMLVTCASVTVMNLVPWGGVVNRTSIVLNMDSSVMWKEILPVQIFGLLCCLVLAVIVAWVETRRGAGVVGVSSAHELTEVDMVADEEAAVLRRPKLLWFNVLLTVFVFVLLLTTNIPNYVTFMIGCVAALLVNFPNIKDQESRINAHAPKVVMLVATVLSAGVLVGVLNNSGMIVSMAGIIIRALPNFLAPHLHMVFAFFGGFLGLGVSPDPLYYGMLPTLLEVMAAYGVPAKSVTYALMLGGDSCFTLSPVISSTYLGLAVSGLSFKEHMKFSLIPLWILGIIMIIFAAATGLIII